MVRAALTGNVAAGKTTVAGHFSEWGGCLIDADAIVRDLQSPDGPLLVEIESEFGTEVIKSDGSLDRARLRGKIVADPTARLKLNSIMHPAVQAQREVLERAAQEAGADVVIHDIPLLFEVMDPNEFETIILVDATTTIRRERLLRRGLSGVEADALMATQMNPADKRRHATHVIDNNGTLEQLRERSLEVWNAIKDGAPRLLDRG